MNNDRPNSPRDRRYASLQPCWPMNEETRRLILNRVEALDYWILSAEREIQAAKKKHPWMTEVREYGPPLSKMKHEREELLFNFIGGLGA